MGEDLQIAVARREFEAERRLEELETVGEMVHADQAAGKRAGLAEDIPAVTVPEDRAEAPGHPPRERAVLHGAAGRQFAVLSFMVLDQRRHIPKQVPSGTRQQSGRIGPEEDIIGTAGVGFSLPAGAVPAIVTDIEGFISLRRGRILHLPENIGCINAGIDARILPNV